MATVAMTTVAMSMANMAIYLSYCYVISMYIY